MLVSSNPNLQGKDANIFTIRIWAELHGLISLYNSGILNEFEKNPKKKINQIIEHLVSSIGKGD